MAESEFFVGVYDPIDVKRNLLESSREVIKSMQSYEVLTHLRKEKLKHYRKMKSVMEELDLLMDKLDKVLPKAQLRKATVHALPKKRKPKPKVKFTDQLEILERQLKTIERELSDLR
jgi:hypothetical protein